MPPLVLKPCKSKRILRNWRGPSRRLPRSLGLMHRNVEKRLKQLGLFKKVRGGWEGRSLVSYLNGGHNDMELLLLVVASRKTRRNNRELWLRRFRIDIRENLLTRGVAQA